MRNFMMWNLAIAVLFASYATVVVADDYQPNPREEKNLFNGKDLKGWTGNEKYWSVENGQIVGKSTEFVPENQFLWFPGEASDFHLSLDVKLTPNSGNSGIQFRSKPMPHGHAKGYQADIGAGSWVRLYEEMGRNFLDWPEEGEKHVKPEEWNHYEILAIGHHVWTAVNGHISVAIHDEPGDLKGRFSVQLHAGPPMDLRFKNIKLVHNPEYAIAGKNKKQLMAAIRPLIKKVAWQRPVFELRDGDTVVFTGGTNAVMAQRHGYLESLLTAANADKKIRFRNMAWQADTVFRQQRPYQFGRWDKYLDKVDASVIFTSFGQTEAMAGPAGIPGFIAAYEKLLDHFAKHADQIVVLSPIAFEMTERPLPDLTVHNTGLRKYVDAMREMAARRGHVFVDLFTPSSALKKDERWTEDGLHVAVGAFAAYAVHAAEQLGVAVRPWSELEPLRTAVVQKNTLWFDYWRPMNWAFLGGSRTMVEFSRGPDHKERMFPKEMEEFLPLIAKTEAKIQSLVGAESR